MSFTKIPVLHQQLFMKKLMILSASFVCLSTMNFFFLPLDRFIQFLFSSSVIISLEFVLSNLRLAVSEDLLPLSVQKSPNLFMFRVFVSEFLGSARDSCHGKQRVSPFYHDSLTTTTDRTTGLLLQSDRLVFGTY